MIDPLAFYAKHGAALFPIRAGSKEPFGIIESFKHDYSNDPTQWAKWQLENPGCNFGVVAFASNWITCDIDTTKVDRNEAWAAWCALCTEWGIAVAQPHVQSARGGWHCYFSVPEGVDATQLRQPDAIKGIVNIRCTGYTVAAGSYYDGTAKGEISGHYQTMSDAPPLPAPDALVRHCSRVGRAAAPVITGTKEKDDVAGLVKWMAERDMFDTHDDWYQCGMAVKLEFGDDGLEIWKLAHNKTVTDDVESAKWQSFATEPTAQSVTINSLMKRAHDKGWKGAIRDTLAARFAGVTDLLPPVPSSSTSLVGPRGEILPFDSDEALALDFASSHADDLRFNAETGRWLAWNGQFWKPDKTAGAYYLIRNFLRTIAVNSAFDVARKVASAQKVSAVERMARTDPRIVTTNDIWDADPWSLCTPQGTLDLRTGKLRDASPADHSTKITAIAPGGDCPLFRSFLHRSLGGDLELIDFLQRALGYSLSGVTTEHQMFFLHGAGGNGKGVLMNSVAALFGDYSRTASAETFLASHNDRHPTDIAGLQGSRLVVASEVPKGRHWDEPKVKGLTGGDRVTARFMRGDFFDFIPQFKLWIVGNHRPRLRSVDEAIRRRMNLIEFNINIPESERDPSLPEKLKAEWSGILQWLVDGCSIWQRSGLQPPSSVRLATNNYLTGQDTVAAWIEDCAETGPDFWAPRNALYTSWKIWSQHAGEVVGNRSDFVDALRAKFPEKGRNGDRGFGGIRLKLPPPPPTSSASSAAGLGPITVPPGGF